MTSMPLKKTRKQKKPRRNGVFDSQIKNYLTASLRDLPALKAGTFIAGILIF